MQNTPKSMRLQLAICGRINAGKSTLLNLIAGQESAITSPERGTTTDVVEKTMEQLNEPGPVSLDRIFEADKLAREIAHKIAKGV